MLEDRFHLVRQGFAARLKTRGRPGAFLVVLILIFVVFAVPVDIVQALHIRHHSPRGRRGGFRFIRQRRETLGRGVLRAGFGPLVGHGGVVDIDHPVLGADIGDIACVVLGIFGIEIVDVVQRVQLACLCGGAQLIDIVFGFAVLGVVVTGPGVFVLGLIQCSSQGGIILSVLVQLIGVILIPGVAAIRTLHVTPRGWDDLVRHIVFRAAIRACQSHQSSACSAA